MGHSIDDDNYPQLSCTKGMEEGGEVKVEYGKIWWRNKMMLTTEEWCNPVSNMLHHA